MPKKKTQKKKIESAEMDLNKFTSAEFVNRTGTVPVPDMKDFYPKGVKPVIKVRSLTALELARVDENVKANADARREETVKSLSSEAVDALRTLLKTHLDEHTPDSYVKTLNMVHLGMVEPKMEYEQVIKFATVFPIEFRLVFIKVNQLTGRGQDYVGKQKDSGQTLESSTA
jgi:hypothetical protein